MEDALDPRVAALHEECERLGYRLGLDYWIEGLHASFSSELILLTHDGDAYRVVYRDMGHERQVASARSFDEIRPVFLEEVGWLAAGRLRGPYVGLPTRAEQLADSRTEDDALAAFEELERAEGADPDSPR
jgi:hypothetical protein